MSLGKSGATKATGDAEYELLTAICGGKVEVAELPEGFPATGLSDWRFWRYGWPPATPGSRRYSVYALTRGINPQSHLPLSEAEAAAMSEADRRVRARCVQHICEMLDGYQELFVGYGDPRAPWDALLLARSFNVPVPEWVMLHLDRAGGELLDALTQEASSRKKTKAKKNSAAEIAGRAIGFGGRRGVSDAASQASVWIEYEEIALEVDERVESGDGHESAREAVAMSRHVSKSKVRDACNWYARERNRLPVKYAPYQSE